MSQHRKLSVQAEKHALAFSNVLINLTENADDMLFTFVNNCYVYTL